MKIYALQVMRNKLCILSLCLTIITIYAPMIYTAPFIVYTAQGCINYLLTYDSYGPVHNRFHRGECITWASGGEGPQECPGPPPPTGPSNAFVPMKSIMHSAIRILGQ